MHTHTQSTLARLKTHLLSDIHTYIHACMHTHTHTLTYIHTYIHTHIYAYTHIHTHTHTQSQNIPETGSPALPLPSVRHSLLHACTGMYYPETGNPEPDPKTGFGILKPGSWNRDSEPGSRLYMLVGNPSKHEYAYASPGNRETGKPGNPGP